ncbi:MAG: glutamyl-tRNA reductase [Pseudomonadota bacterium]
MNVLIIGSNHNKAPINVRERLAFVKDDLPSTLKRAHEVLALESLVILSTCNRTELIITTFDMDQATQDMLASSVFDWWSESNQIELVLLRECTYVYAQEAAVKHVVEVASGIDSMVLGEPQIFGQLKSAVASTESAIGLSGQSQRFYQSVFSYAKKVRTDTAIGKNPVSVAYVALQLSKNIFSSLKGRNALLIGAGDTIELVAKNLFDKGVSRIVVANRTLSNAQHVADKFSGQAILLSDMSEQLDEFDIVVSSTGSQLPILGKGAVESALKRRRQKPVFMLDLAVPRDIEVEVSELSNVYLYSIDDLSSIVKENSVNRQCEVSKADVIIQDAVATITQHNRSLVAVDTIRSLRDQALLIRDQELKKAHNQLANNVPPEEVLNSLAHNLSNKLMHSPTVELKQAGAHGRQDLLMWARKLFGIDEPDS